MITMPGNMDRALQAGGVKEKDGLSVAEILNYNSNSARTDGTRTTSSKQEASRAAEPVLLQAGRAAVKAGMPGPKSIGDETARLVQMHLSPGTTDVTMGADQVLAEQVILTYRAKPDQPKQVVVVGKSALSGDPSYKP